MTPQQKSALISQLQAREKALYLDIRRELAKRDGDGSARVEVPDPGDASAEDLATYLTDAEIGRDVHELRAIGEALQRAASDAFGTCVACGQPIPFARLQAEPQALRCRPCQDVHDRTHADGARGATL